MRALRSFGRGSAVVLVAVLALGASSASAATCGLDAFDGTALDARWTVLRPDGNLTVGGGKLSLPFTNTDLIGGTASAANLVLQDAPAGGWTATTELNIAGIDKNGEQAGLALWRSEGPNTFGKVTFIQTNSGARQFEAIWTEDNGVAIPIGNSSTALPAGVPADADVLLRLRSDGYEVAAEFSTDDGATWAQIGRVAHFSGPLRVGLLALGNDTSDGAATFERFTLDCAADVTASATTGAAPLDVDFTGADGTWDFGDGATATGAAPSHTFAAPGTYRVRNSLLDVTGSRVVTATACPAASDDFTGTALDPKWQIRRPRLTGLDVSGGELRLLPYGGDMHGTNASVRNVLLQPAPTGPWKATAKLDISGTTTNDQAGIIVWRGEAPNNFAKIVYNRRSLTSFWVERQNNVDGVTQSGGGDAGTISPVPTADLYIRASSDGAASPAISAEFSLDGTTWTPVKAPFQVGGSGQLKVGIAYWGPTGLRTGAFDSFHVEGPTACGDPDAIAPETTATLSPPLPPGGRSDVPVTVTLSAVDDAAGSGVETTEYSVDGGAFTAYAGPFTVSADGDHTMQYRSRDHAGNTEATHSANFAIGEPQPVNIFTTIGITESANRGNSQIFGDPTPYSLPAEEMPPSRSIAPAPADTLDDVPVRMPNTSGTVPNLAAFHGQTVVLRDPERLEYSTVHFFGTTTDGGPAGGDFILTYDDGSTQTSTVRFRDWCDPGDPTELHHIAIGPLSQRYRTDGADGARCGIYHVPVGVDANKTLVSVKLPSTTTPGDSPIQAYLMALTLEQPNGDFVTPDLGASPFPDDFDAPVSTHQLTPGTPQGQGGWYSSDVTVTLAADDGADGSGVAGIEYRIDNGAFAPYTAPVTVSGEGAHVVQYRARDRAGNVEAPRSVDVKIDDSDPAVTAALDPRAPSGGDWYDTPVELRLTGSDGAGSGVALIEYRLNGGAWQAYHGPVRLAGPRAYTVETRATDVAGHTAAGAPLALKVDPQAPVTRAVINGAAPAQNYTGAVTVALAAADAGSGVAGTEVSVDDGAPRAYSGPFTVSGFGVHYVAFHSSDAAGNLENTREIAFRIATPPQGGEQPTPEPDPWAAIAKPAASRATVAAFRAGRLKVGVRCVAVERGTLRLTVSRATARRLGVKSRTLAHRSFSCADGRVDVALKPARKVKRALGRHGGTLRAVLTVRTAGENGRASAMRRVTLRRRR
jgi:PKD repeat protein